MKQFFIFSLIAYSLFSFGQGTVFIPGNIFSYHVEYKTDEFTTTDTIRIVVTGNPWKQSPENQKEIIINYDLKNIDTSLFRGIESIGWVNADTTGAVENDKTCWFHPPRHNQFKLLELAPFPQVDFPLELDRTWSKVLFIGAGWGEISNTKVYWNYRITGYSDSAWMISAEARPSGNLAGINRLDFIFSETNGFERLYYSFSNGTKVSMLRIH
jgi:hypothetical protein